MIAISGRGVTALVCAQVLRDRGHEVRLCGGRRRLAPTVVLADDTLRLLAEIFHDPDLPRLGHELNGRRVWWEGPPREVAAPGRSVDLGDLGERLESVLGDVPVDEDASPAALADAPWSLDASGRTAALAERWGGGRAMAFGERHALASRVSLRPAVRRAAALERVAGGWLFFVPTAPDRGSVQLILPARPEDPAAALEGAVAGSPSLRSAGAELDGAPAVFPCHPRILPRLYGERWLAVGEAAIALDPLCGDGVGAAVRSALLACAVVDGQARGGGGSLLEHYQRRHQRSFVLHLRHLWDHYRPLLAGSRAWRRELESTGRLLRSPRARDLAAGEGFAFRMAGGDLVPAALTPDPFPAGGARGVRGGVARPAPGGYNRRREEPKEPSCPEPTSKPSDPSSTPPSTASTASGWWSACGRKTTPSGTPTRQRSPTAWAGSTWCASRRRTIPR